MEGTLVGTNYAAPERLALIRAGVVIGALTAIFALIALGFPQRTLAIETYYYCNMQVAPQSPCPEHHSRRTFSYNKATNQSAGIGTSVCQKVTTEQGSGSVYGAGGIYTRICGYNVVSSGDNCGQGGCLGYAFVGNNNSRFTLPIGGEAHYR